MAFIIPYSYILSSGVTSTILSVLGNVTLKTIKIFSSFSSEKNIEINAIIYNLDIERKICLAKSVIKYIHKKSKSKLKNNIVLQKEQQHIIDDYNPIDVCLYYMCKIIKEINDILEETNNKIIKHKKKWLKIIRPLNIDSYVALLKEKIKLFDIYFNDILKIFQVFKEEMK